MTNTALLEAKISESGLMKKYLADKLGISPYGLANKINNKTEFKGNEIKELCNILNITSLRERENIFFAD